MVKFIAVQHWLDITTIFCFDVYRIMIRKSTMEKMGSYVYVLGS